MGRTSRSTGNFTPVINRKRESFHLETQLPWGLQWNEVNHPETTGRDWGTSRNWHDDGTNLNCKIHCWEILMSIKLIAKVKFLCSGSCCGKMCCTFQDATCRKHEGQNNIRQIQRLDYQDVKKVESSLPVVVSHKLQGVLPEEILQGR